jgi:hypothetical protein
MRSQRGRIGLRADSLCDAVGDFSVRGDADQIVRRVIVTDKGLQPAIGQHGQVLKTVLVAGDFAEQLARRPLVFQDVGRGRVDDDVHGSGPVCGQGRHNGLLAIQHPAVEIIPFGVQPLNAARVKVGHIDTAVAVDGDVAGVSEHPGAGSITAEDQRCAITGFRCLALERGGRPGSAGHHNAGSAGRRGLPKGLADSGINDAHDLVTQQGVGQNKRQRGGPDDDQDDQHGKQPPEATTRAPPILYARIGQWGFDHRGWKLHHDDGRFHRGLKGGSGAQVFWNDDHVAAELALDLAFVALDFQRRATGGTDERLDFGHNGSRLQ